MGMLDQDFRRIRHPVSAIKPPVAELAILCGSTGISLIEAADGLQAVCRQSQIVGGKEVGWVGVRVLVGVELMNQHLAGSRLRVGGAR